MTTQAEGTRRGSRATGWAHWYDFAKGVVGDFVAHDVMSLAAAVAFYTALSFAPLVLLLISTGSFLGDSTQSELIRFFDQQLGPRAAEVTEAVVSNSKSEPEQGGIGRWIISTVLLIVSASGVFAQLQSSLNTIWQAEGKPKEGLWNWLRRRLVSMGMVFTILFILLVALVISSVIEHIVPSGQELASRIGVFVGSFVVSTLLFAAIFKVLPDRKVPWRAVWLGAAITSALFALGKLLVSLYMEHGGVGDSYGEAAGALIALLVWVYYSCVILFIGAEITQRLSAEHPSSAPGAESLSHIGKRGLQPASASVRNHHTTRQMQDS